MEEETKDKIAWSAISSISIMIGLIMWLVLCFIAGVFFAKTF